MSERGESLDPVRMLNVASWRKLRASRREVQRGLESQNLRPPNMRVQRTRALASLGTLTSFARSPLTRRPLGGRSSRQQRNSSGIPSHACVVVVPTSLGGECRLMVARGLRVAASSRSVAAGSSVAGNLRST